jgi:hypothetical protein
MPRFYFHLENRGARVRDEVGLALPDAEAAFYQAVRSGRDLIMAESRIGGRVEDQTVEIEEEGGMPVDRIPLREIARFATGG